MDPWKTDDESWAMPARPCLKPWYRQAVAGDALALEYGHSTVVFEGRAVQQLLPALLPLLDGTRTTAQIVDKLGAVSEPAVTQALRLLAERRLLLDGAAIDEAEPAGARHTVEFIASIGRQATLAEVQETLVAADVVVIGSGAAAPHVVALLRESGVRRVEQAGWSAEPAGSGGPQRLVLVLPGADELAEVAGWNRSALESGTTWLQVLPYDGRFAAIGPLYVPRETCCYECYRTRRSAASGYAAEFDAIDNAVLQAPSPPALDAVIAGVAVMLATRWIAQHDHYLPGMFYACEQGGTSLTQHRVYRVPRCLACSGLHDTAPPLPWFKEVAPDREQLAREQMGVAG